MRKTRGGEHGQGLVEAALLLPLLVLITMGVIDFGRLYFSYTSIVNAAREGAACASLGALCAGGAAAAAAAEVGGMLQGGITTTVSPASPTPGSTVTVTVQYQFKPITTAIIKSTTLPISASASMVVQQ
jgi:Flp pilus assembly protein TadG